MTRGDVSICAADMITTVFQNIEGARLSESSRIVGAWRTVVGSIVSRKNGEIVKIGEKLCGHSSVVDVKNSVLLVEADHSGWIQLLHTYQKYIVTGLRRTVPEVKIHSVVFRLRGSECGLRKVDYDAQMAAERKKREAQLERQEEVLGRYAPPRPPRGAELPGDLKKIFDDMKNSVLTKNEQIC